MNKKFRFLYFLFSVFFCALIISCGGIYGSASSIRINLPYGYNNRAREGVSEGIITYNFEITCSSPSNSENYYTASGKSGDSIIIEVAPDFYEISCCVYDLDGELCYEGIAEARVRDQEEVGVKISLKSVKQPVIEPETVTITIYVDKQDSSGNDCGSAHDYGFINYDPDELIQIPEGKMLFKVSQDDEVKIKYYEWYFNGKKMDSDGDYILIDEGSIDFYEIGTYLIECIMELEDGCIIDVKAEINVNAPIYV